MSCRTIIHWNNIQLRQYTDCCNFKIFVNRTVLTCVSTARLSYRFARHSREYIKALCLKCGPGKSLFLGLFQGPLHSTSLSLQEMRHPPRSIPSSHSDNKRLIKVRVLHLEGIINTVGIMDRDCCPQYSFFLSPSLHFNFKFQRYRRRGSPI